jgi:hypothetical protein
LNVLPFAEVWACDFEFFAAEPGDNPTPISMAARELRSGRLIRLWQDELERLPASPIPISKDVLFVAFYASAEISCYLSLGWPLPTRILDLFTEFRAARNGSTPLNGWSLLSALSEYGLNGMSAVEKTEMRDLVMRGPPFTGLESNAILDYCQGDVDDAVVPLLPRMLPGILGRGLGAALLRGRYMKAIAVMERTGVPIDVPVLERLRRHWDSLRHELIVAVDRDFGVYDGTTFKLERFERYLATAGILWPRTPSGRLATDEDTFRNGAKAHPQLEPLRELRTSLSQLKLNDLAVGADGRNRTMLSAFRTITGRNAPSNSRFIFGPAVWLRSLIRPVEGTVLAYIDWSGQEIAIAAYLSGDPAMIAAYETGDVYLAFAVQAGLAPEGATKETHGAIREQCKILLLGIGYGMSEIGLAHRLDCQWAYARSLLELHHRTYPRFWTWADGAVTTAERDGGLASVFGWPLKATAATNWRTLQNFPIQSAGAEMLRLACIFGTEMGLRICAPIHDAVLLEAPAGPAGWEQIIAMRQAMARASRHVLAGAEIRTDVKLVPWPERYSDPRGAEMWTTVSGLLAKLEERETRWQAELRL